MITAKFLREQNACYSNESLEALFPQPRSLKEVLTLQEGEWEHVPDKDRVWVALQPGILSPEILFELLARFVERVLKAVEDPDPRSAAVVEALRKGEVSKEVAAKAEDAYSAAHRLPYDSPGRRAARCAYRSAVAGCIGTGWLATYYATEAAWDEATLTPIPGERKAQIADILELIGG